MSQPIRFLIAVIVGLALLTTAAAYIAGGTMQDWFERDVALRAQVAVSGARQTLVERWRDKNQRAIVDLLNDLTHDERIMAAAACDTRLERIAATDAFPRDFSCGEIGVHVRPQTAAPANDWHLWSTMASLPGGNVSVIAVPVVDGETVLGFVVLVHDMNFLQRRDVATRRFLILAFAILSVAASLLTLVAARLSWRGWTSEIRRLLQGGVSRPEFQPLLRDVRELVDRISSEREMEGQGSLWTPQRLKDTLKRYLLGERVVVLANREPYIHERTDEGGVKVVHPASGLVTALEPIMRACSGVWIAHGAGSADRETADKHARLNVPPGEDAYVLRRVWLTPEEESGYYYGYANEGLWPLCHIAHTRPIFRTDDWDVYQAVNEKFARAVCEEVDTDDPIVLVQDYHFALAPKMIRAKLPRATILAFWHVPWPSSESFGICPQREAILEGLLGSSILGFHTQTFCNNFLECVDRFLEARLDRDHFAVVQKQHVTLVRPYPIAIEWPNHWTAAAPPVDECRRSVLAELDLPSNTLLGVGVDRLDYTKGIEERLLAVERLLERYPAYRGRFTFVQLAAPSRTIIDQYRHLRERVHRTAARINARFADGVYRPIIMRESHHEPPTVFRYYRAADLCYVSSLHDGMNLVAKEFVAARDDERGVLVLSQFAGASRELTESLIVNPYDLDEAGAALATALEMPLDEQRDRMRSMRSLLAEFNVYRWAGRMLVDAERLRRREKLTGRLREPRLQLAGGRAG